MTIPLPLASDLAAERARELRAAATHHRLARLGRHSRRAERVQPVAGADAAPASHRGAPVKVHPRHEAEWRSTGSEDLTSETAA
jgi:hypothetical protein